MIQYQSTRNQQKKISASKAILSGISDDGGLFVPTKFPQISKEDLEALVRSSYQKRALYLLSSFLSDFSEKELSSYINKAYHSSSFSDIRIAPLIPINDHTYTLELWHGPTCAFKDIALQLLPQLLTASAKKENLKKEIVILTATSGDTGKAALEGFKNIPNTRIFVFYPARGVSQIQRLQMTTQEGNNTFVFGVNGNFDDTQSAIKKVFNDPNFNRILKNNHLILTSANSINWGRLVPQIVYYFSAYCDLIQQGKIVSGTPINIAVPTGNFGNILAAYYAKQMGLPIHKLICASNANDVLTEFIQTGVYNKNRRFFKTLSPSMDILISSNLERLIFHLANREVSVIQDLYAKLEKKGAFSFPVSLLKNDFYAGSCNDHQTKKMIQNIFEKYQYLCDPHTAVAFHVYSQYQQQTGDHFPAVIVSTASPFKFPSSILSSLGYKIPVNSFKQIEKLARISGQKPPFSLTKLQNKPERFTDVVEKEDVCTQLTSTLERGTL